MSEVLQCSVHFLWLCYLFGYYKQKFDDFIFRNNFVFLKFEIFFLGYVWSFNLLGFHTNFRFVNLVFRWFYFVQSDIFWFLCPAAEDFWFFLYWHYCICCRSGWKNLRIRYLEVLCHLRQKNWSDVPFLKVGDWELRSFRH